MFIERKPIMIASSAYINEETKDECLSIGFDFITEVPMKPQFLQMIFEELDKKKMLFD